MNKLQTEAMDRNNECAPMEPEFRVLPDLGGAAVRGEAPSLTEAELDAMPKRAAFIAWAKDRSLDTTETKDAWGQRAFLHDHIETMWIGWFSAPSVSARAADAPSEPSDEQIISVMKPELDQGDGGYICDMHAEHVVAAGRVLLKSRAADGLDSQPAAIRNAALEEAIQAIEKIDDGEASEYRACQEAISELKGSSQPTDGGVRNG